jgi:hypothetical protein
MAHHFRAAATGEKAALLREVTLHPWQGLPRSADLLSHF